MTKIGQKYLFLGGNPRSGTTVLSMVMNFHEQIFVLVERNMQSFKRGELVPAHYDAEEVFSSEKGLLPHYVKDMEAARAKHASATYIGDKFPPLYAGFGLLDERFPDSTCVFIVRNPLSVAASYGKWHRDGRWKKTTEDGVAEWNRSVQSGLRYCKAGMPLIVLSYEGFFSSSENLRELFARLNLDPDQADWASIREKYAQADDLFGKEEARNDPLRRYVSLNADFESYRLLMKQNAIGVGEDHSLVLAETMRS